MPSRRVFGRGGGRGESLRDKAIDASAEADRVLKETDGRAQRDVPALEVLVVDPREQDAASADQAEIPAQLGG